MTFTLGAWDEPPSQRAMRHLAAHNSSIRRRLNTSASTDGKSSVLIEPAQVQAALQPLLPEGYPSTVSSEPTGGVEVWILLLPDMDGSGADDIVQMVSGPLLSDLSNALGVYIGFVTPPTITSTIVAAPPPPSSRPWTPPGIAPPLMPPQGHFGAGTGGTLSDLSSSEAESDHLVLYASLPAGLVVLMMLFVVLFCWNRRRQGKKKKRSEAYCSSTTMESIPPPVQVSIVDKTEAGLQVIAPSEAMSESSVNFGELWNLSPSTLEPGAVSQQIATHLERSESERRSRRWSSVPPESEVAADEDSVDEDNDDNDTFGSVAQELNAVRVSRAKATEEGGPSKRLQQLLEEHRKADLLLLQQRELMFHPTEVSSPLRMYNPDSAENQALIREQALALTLHARRRARERNNSHPTGSPSEGLDLITQSIRRGSLNGADLYRQSGAEDSAPESWLLNVMTPALGSDTSAASDAATRLVRARMKAAYEERLARANGAGALARSASGGDLSRPKPRSLAEIRSASHSALSPPLCSPRRAAGFDANNAGPAAATLDPLTDALHLAAMTGVAPPPPPNDWSQDSTRTAADSAERLARARSDRQSRLKAAKHQSTPSPTSLARSASGGDLSRPKPRSLAEIRSASHSALSPPLCLAAPPTSASSPIRSLPPMPAPYHGMSSMAAMLDAIALQSGSGPTQGSEGPLQDSPGSCSPESSAAQPDSQGKLI